MPGPFETEVHRWEPIRDGEPVPSLEWLRRQVEFVDAQRQGSRSVFVHCRNGVSRGGMLMVAYIMWRDHRSRDEALAFVRSKRDIVRPNAAFMRLLLDWQASLAERPEGASKPE